MTIEEKTLDSDEEILHLMGSSITVKNIENLLNVITAHNKDKSEEDSIDSVIENYFGDANYAHTTTHYEDFESAIMRLCAYEVIKRDYNIISGGNDNHMMYLSGLPHHKVASDKIIEEIVSLVEKKSQELKSN